jgi:hypothetical protein
METKGEEIIEAEVEDCIYIDLTLMVRSAVGFVNYDY